MSRLVFRNRVSVALANNQNTGGVEPNYSATDTEFWVDGTGTEFPPASVSILNEFFISINNQAGITEICLVTERTANKLTVLRGQDDTLAVAWNVGDLVEMRPHAGSMDRMLQNQDDKLIGPLDANDQDITDPAIRGGSSFGMDIKATDGLASNTLVVPPNGVPVTIGGYAVWTTKEHPEDDSRYYNPPGSIIMWNGEIAPPDWALCDGKPPPGGGIKPTPDLRARFIMGWNSGDGAYPKVAGAPAESETMLAEAGDYLRTVSPQLGHNHTGLVGDHTLTSDEIPNHVHKARGNDNESSSGLFGVGGPGEGYRDMYTNLDGKDEEPNMPGGLPHDHTIDTDGAHSHTLDKDDLTPYIVLAFIIKLNQDGQVP